MDTAKVTSPFFIGSVSAGEKAERSHAERKPKDIAGNRAGKQGMEDRKQTGAKPKAEENTSDSGRKSEYTKPGKKPGYGKVNRQSSGKRKCAEAIFCD